MNKEEYLTTGQLSKLTGITLRTLRYYDQIGLLTPVKEQTGSTRLYSRADLARLQRIQTLKYVGMTLDEIRELLSADVTTDRDMRGSLQAQLDMLRRKMDQMERVAQAIRRAFDTQFDGPVVPDWDRFTAIIQTVQTEQRWAEQYRDAGRLQKRIHLYDKYSVNPYGWHLWVFDLLGQRLDVHILELGCGDGALWHRNIERIPKNGASPLRIRRLECWKRPSAT